MHGMVHTMVNITRLSPRNNSTNGYVLMKKKQISNQNTFTSISSANHDNKGHQLFDFSNSETMENVGREGHTCLKCAQIILLYT
jgi:hypothetical protein